VIYVTLNQVPAQSWQGPGENQQGSQWDPVWFPHNSPGGLLNSPPGATAPTETEQQATGSHDSPREFQWEIHVYAQLQ